MDRIFRAPFLFPQHTKEFIVLLLMYENPLNVKQIWNRVRYERKVSYKTVYKAVNELLSAGVLSRSKQAYSLNMDWIRCLKLFTENVELLYEKKGVKSSASASSVSSASSDSPGLDSLLE